jgi:hypothetical protein
MISDIIRLALITEALIFILFTAAPVQPFRAWLITATPWATDKRSKEHVLRCARCSGWWVLQIVFVLWYFWGSAPWFAFLNIFIMYRLFIVAWDLFGLLFTLGHNAILWRSRK